MSSETHRKLTALLPLLAADPSIGTPAYIYDLDGIAADARELVAEVGASGLVAYAVKANAAGPVVRSVACFVIVPWQSTH